MSGNGDSILIYLVDEDGERRARVTEKLSHLVPSIRVEEFGNAGDARIALMKIQNVEHLPRLIVAGDNVQRMQGKKLSPTGYDDIFEMRSRSIQKRDTLEERGMAVGDIPVFAYIQSTTDTFEISKLGGVKIFQAAHGEPMDETINEMCAAIKDTLFPNASKIDRDPPDSQGRGR